MKKQEKKREFTTREFWKLNIACLHHLSFHFMEVWGENAIHFIEVYPICYQKNGRAKA